MEYPKRVSQHISESSSFKLISSLVPKEWIIRELTERDYGIDLYIEIVNEDGCVTGDLVALQVKSENIVNFSNESSYTYSGIKRTTINYWLGLPVPVFLVVASLQNNQCDWTSVSENNRNGRFSNNAATVSLVIKEWSNFTVTGLMAFVLTYVRERRWAAIENAIANSLMSYNIFGPLVLMCKRNYNPNEFCSTTVQYLLIQHYEYFSILYRYILGGKPMALPEWYAKNVEYCAKSSIELRPTFAYAIIIELINYFAFKYRDCMLACYRMVLDSNAEYFEHKLPYLSFHLRQRPHTFILDDWAARYYFDKYENETKNPERMFFKDFEEFDKITHEPY
jgi:hypothetical protein